MKLNLKDFFLGALLPLVLVVTGVGIYVVIPSQQAQKSEKPSADAFGLLPFLPIAQVAPVRTLAQVSETLDLRVHGTVVPYRELQLAAEVSGRITEKNATVRSGNYVTKGQILYRIDPRDYEFEVERLSGRRDQELASIKELEQDIVNAQDLLNVIDQELKLAEAEVRRFEKLDATFASAAELDQARRSRLSSMNQRVSQQNQLRTLRTRISRFDLAAKLAETELEKARLNLTRTVVRAPVNGRVVSEQVEADSYVQKGTPLLVVEDTEKVEVACNLRMDQLYWILDQPNLSTDDLVSAAQAASYELPQTQVDVRFHVAGRESITYQWQGQINRYDGAGLEPQSRTVPILIRVDDPNHCVSVDPDTSNRTGVPALVRGMFVDLVIKARPSTQLMLVPKLSIKPSSHANVIWKYSPDPEALFATSIARAALEAEEEASGNPPTESIESASDPDDKKTTIDPDEWQTGYLKLVEGVQMVTSYWGDEEIDYWVCEVPSGELAPGDLVIVEPLPGVKADGSDPIRVRKTNLNSRLDAPLVSESHGTTDGETL